MLQLSNVIQDYYPKIIFKDFHPALHLHVEGGDIDKNIL